MARIVRKYGGSSLATPEKIRQVASRIADLRWSGDEVVVVVSAMASTTDDLMKMAYDLHPDPPRRELDMLLSVGERISCSLLALAIEAEGLGAISYTGSQVGIITDTKHGHARIVDIRPTRLFEALERNMVVVVAGFQGVSIEKEITTLGRGGSDATAVALAAAIGADRCELMKEVDGLYTGNPQQVDEALVIDHLDYKSALRLGIGGTKALQAEAAQIARDYKIPLAIGNTDTDSLGTIITDQPFDKGLVVGLARRDGLVQRMGVGSPPSTDEIIQYFEHRGRWIAWRAGLPGEDAPFSGITIVTTCHAVPGLHESVTSILREKGIPTFGHMERKGEYWVGVESAHADSAINILHHTCMEKGWLRERQAPDDSYTA